MENVNPEELNTVQKRQTNFTLVMTFLWGRMQTAPEMQG